MWWDSGPSRLSGLALAALSDPSHSVSLSVVNLWEILIKAQLGKLTLRAPLRQIVEHQRANGIQILPVTLSHVLAIEGLPPIHKDPFDRLLAAQAVAEGAMLVTADEIFRSYPVSVLW
jgi:PIN domain nuclease of toxin-antitoxin system